MADPEYYSFEEALSELRLKEEELKRLVSEGEIRAFREGDTMRLRRGDVEALREELTGGGEVLDLGGSDELGSSESLVFPDEAGMATEEISDVDTIIDDDVPDVGEIDVEEEERPAVAAVAPVRRTPVRAQLEDDEVHESVGMRALLILTALLLICALPVIFSISSGNLTDLAEPFASMFREK